MTEYWIDDAYIGDFIRFCKYLSVDYNRVNTVEDVLTIVRKRNGVCLGHRVMTYNPDTEPNYYYYGY